MASGKDLDVCWDLRWIWLAIIRLIQYGLIYSVKYLQLKLKHLFLKQRRYLLYTVFIESCNIFTFFFLSYFQNKGKFYLVFLRILFDPFFWLYAPEHFPLHIFISLLFHYFFLVTMFFRKVCVGRGTDIEAGNGICEPNSVVFTSAMLSMESVMGTYP